MAVYDELEPVSRIEHFLAKIAENTAGGGSGGEGDSGILSSLQFFTSYNTNSHTLQPGESATINLLGTWDSDGNDVVDNGDYDGPDLRILMGVLVRSDSVFLNGFTTWSVNVVNRDTVAHTLSEDDIEVSIIAPSDMFVSPGSPA